MSHLQIPQDLRPSGPLESAGVTIDIQGAQDIDRCLDEADDILNQAGLVKVNTNMARLMHALGGKYDTVGVLKSNRGASIMNQHALINSVVAMNKAISEEPDVEKKSKYVYALGYVAEKLAKITALMNRSEEEHKIAADAASPQRRSSFVPGSVVNSNPGTIVHATNVQFVGQGDKAP